MLETHFSYTLEVIRVSVCYGSSVWSKLLLLVNGGEHHGGAGGKLRKVRHGEGMRMKGVAAHHD